MKGYIPSKHAIVSGVIVFAIAMLIYNKVPAFRKVTGGMAA